MRLCGLTACALLLILLAAAVVLPRPVAAAPPRRPPTLLTDPGRITPVIDFDKLTNSAVIGNT